MPPDSDPLRTEELLDTVRYRLEDGWQSGSELPVEELLRDLPPDLADTLLPQFLAMEIRVRRIAGQDPIPEDYYARFPDAEVKISEAFRIAAEIESGAADAAVTGSETWQAHDPVVLRQQAVPPLELAPGDFFGRFELIEKIGSGGFGTVWRARDTVLNRPVALKTPRSEQLDPKQLASFLHEAQAAARIRYRGVVQVYETGTEDGIAFIASEYIDGPSLQEALADQSLSFVEIASLCRRVADALQQAHETDIIHKDLKPSNILLDADGEPHVTDFGLAKIGANDRSDELGWIIGTLPYMSPEQTRGANEQLGPATDVYSLGVVLFELLTRQRPFSGERWALLRDIQQEPAPKLRRLDRRIPRDLEAICLKCLAKDPSQRYQSAADLAEDLRRYLAGEPVRARPGTVVGRSWSWCRRKPALAILGGTLAVVLAGTVAVLSVAYLNSQELLAEAETHLYFHHISATHQRWLINDAPAARTLLADCPDRRRDIEWHLLDCLLRTPESKLEDAGPAFALCPDGNRLIACGSRQRSVKFLEKGSRHAVERKQDSNKDQGTIEWIDVDPSGRYFVTAETLGDVLRLRDVETGETIRAIGRHHRAVFQAFFTMRGTHIISASRDDTVRVSETDTGEEVATFRFRPQRLRAIAVSPIDSCVAVATGYAGNSAVSIWCYETREKIADVPTVCEQVTGLAFSTDGSLLALAEPRGVLQIWQTSPLEHVLTMTGPLANYPYPVFDSSGGRVAAATWDGSIRIWNTATGREVRVLRGHLPPTGALRFTPDGDALVAGSTDDVIRHWDTRVEQGAIALPDTADSVIDTAVSPRGDWLAVAARDGSVSLWNTATRERQWTASLSQDRVFAVAFSPDGQRLACGCEDTNVHILSVADGHEERVFRKHDQPLRSVVFSPNGCNVASAGIGDKVLVWDARTGETVQTLSLTTIAIRSLAFHPNETHLAAGTRDGVTVVWNTETGKEVWRHNTAKLRIWDVAWSPHGDVLAVAHGDGRVRIRAARDGRVLKTLGIPALDAEVDLAFTFNGRRLITGVAQKLVVLWELPTGREVLRLSQHTATAPAIAIDPKNRFVVTSRLDGTVLLWPATRDFADSVSIRPLENSSTPQP